MARLTAKVRNDIADREFAFPLLRKEPLENAIHVRSAVARFNQVRGVTELEKDAAWKRILDAAARYGVIVHESTWHELLTDQSHR